MVTISKANYEELIKIIEQKKREGRNIISNNEMMRIFSANLFLERYQRKSAIEFLLAKELIYLDGINYRINIGILPILDPKDNKEVV